MEKLQSKKVASTCVYPFRYIIQLDDDFYCSVHTQLVTQADKPFVHVSNANQNDFVIQFMMYSVRNSVKLTVIPTHTIWIHKINSVIEHEPRNICYHIYYTVYRYTQYEVFILMNNHRTQFALLK